MIIVNYYIFIIINNLIKRFLRALFSCKPVQFSTTASYSQYPCQFDALSFCSSITERPNTFIYPSFVLRVSHGASDRQSLLHPRAPGPLVRT